MHDLVAGVAAKEAHITYLQDRLFEFQAKEVVNGGRYMGPLRHLISEAGHSTIGLKTRIVRQNYIRTTAFTGPES